MRQIDVRECHDSFGKFIRAARVEKSLYQAEVAEKCDITQSHLSKIESGDRDISIGLALKICAALDVNIQDFVNKYL